ncbi:hypothetical protein Golax_016067, partial [Gossypium laxum]|nr:hypothetical protein [Gossypium laxum]
VRPNFSDIACKGPYRSKPNQICGTWVKHPKDGKQRRDVWFVFDANMAGREVREYTNLSDPKGKWGKGKDKLDDEDIAFQRMVAKGFFWISIVLMESAVSRIPYHFSERALVVQWDTMAGILASPIGLLIQADARGCWRTWRLPTWARRDDLLYLKEQMEAEEDAERLLRRTEKRAFAAFKISYFEHFLQQDLLKKVVEVKPKRPKISSPSSSEPEGNQSNLQSQGQESNHEKKIGHCVSESNTAEKQNKVEKSTKSLLGLAYASSDDDDD